MATTVAMPSSRQRDDVFEAFTRLSDSLLPLSVGDNFDRDAAITACQDGIRAFKVILALLGGSGPDASFASSSEESFTGPGASVDSADGGDPDGEPGGLHSTDDDGGDSSGDDDDDDGFPVMPPVVALQLIGASSLDGRGQVGLDVPAFLCF